MQMEPRIKKKFEKAEKEFQKTWNEVRPFIKERKKESYSTTGKWKTSSLNLSKQKE